MFSDNVKSWSKENFFDWILIPEQLKINYTYLLEKKPHMLHIAASADNDAWYVSNTMKQCKLIEGYLKIIKTLISM